jgi:chromosomal replication initiation ATPase DnaA
MKTKIIAEKTEQVFELRAGSLKRRIRKREVSEARHAYWLIAAYFGFTLSEIGANISRDHSSAYNSITRSLIFCVQDYSYRNKVHSLIKIMKTYENPEEKKRISKRTSLYRCAVDAII